jgi:hypothetical protein
VDASELKQALITHFSPKGLAVNEDAALSCDLVLESANQKWGIVFCPDKARREGPADLQLGMAIAFASTAHGQSPSYRRALKKYSNSIVFEDLGLHLFLVSSAMAVDVLKPTEVNAFMRDLDKWILDQRKGLGL